MRFFSKFLRGKKMDYQQWIVKDMRERLRWFKTAPHMYEETVYNLVQKLRDSKLNYEQFRNLLMENGLYISINPAKITEEDISICPRVMFKNISGFLQKTKIRV